MMTGKDRVVSEAGTYLREARGWWDSDRPQCRRRRLCVSQTVQLLTLSVALCHLHERVAQLTAQSRYCL